MLSTVLSRRTALRTGAGFGAATLIGGAAFGRASAQPGTTGQQIEPRGGTWRTWVLASGSELRPAPPPDTAAAAVELHELRALAAQRDATALERVRYWDAGAPGYRWNELLLDTAAKQVPPTSLSRPASLLNVAIYDATVAAWDAKYAYNRARPG